MLKPPRPEQLNRFHFVIVFEFDDYIFALTTEVNGRRVPGELHDIEREDDERKDNQDQMQQKSRKQIESQKK